MPSKINDCIYELERHPELHEAFKRDLLDGNVTNVPDYIMRVIEQTKSERRMVQLSAIKLKNALSYIEGYVTRAPHRRAYQRALNNLVGNDYKVGRTHAGFLSIEARAEAINGEMHGKMTEFMERMRPRRGGFEISEAAQHEFIRALYGSTTDVDAKGYAKMVTDVLEELRLRFNKSGGNIQELKPYRIPQPSDPYKVGKAGKEGWKAFTIPLLSQAERDMQVRAELGLPMDAPLSAEMISHAMDRVYEGIATRGAANVVPGKQVPGLRKRVSARHQDHRFLHFKDADSWIAYNQKFGDGTPYSAVTSHVDRMSRDIAAMEILGPNPERTLEFLISHVVKKSGKTNAGEQARTLYRDIMGELDGVPNPMVASIFRDARNIMAATKLPAATLSSIADTFFLGRTAMFNDIPIVGVYTRLFKMLNPANIEDRMFAGRIGLTMEYALDKVAAYNRISTMTGNNWTGKMADFALRINGLNLWTTAAEHAFGLEFMANIAGNANLEYGKLGVLREAMARYGITEADWNKIRLTEMVDYKGMKYLDPSLIKDVDVMAKIQGMAIAETRMAVPRPTAKVKAVMHGGHSAGTATGELRRSIFQFKGYPVAIMMNQWARELSTNSGGSKLAGFGSLIAGTTILGALSYNLKEIAKGRTPEDWHTGAFWANGFVQGGGFGLIGDGLFMDPSKTGGVASFLAGPLVGEADKLIRNFVLTPKKDLIEANKDIYRHLADAAVKTGESYLPSPLNLPVMKTAIQRAVFDQLHKMANKNWRTNRRRMARELKERGQSEWWKPGDVAPKF